jgi:hypothetical protein
LPEETETVSSRCVVVLWTVKVSVTAAASDNVRVSAAPLCSLQVAAYGYHRISMKHGHAFAGWLQDAIKHKKRQNFIE